MTSIHNKPIAERIDWLFELAHRHGKAFRSPEARMARERYLSEQAKRSGKILNRPL